VNSGQETYYPDRIWFMIFLSSFRSVLQNYLKTNHVLFCTFPINDFYYTTVLHYITYTVIPTLLNGLETRDLENRKGAFDVTEFPLELREDGW
jgi:hypothetical protein